MDDKTLQRKLNQMIRLGNEIDAEAKRRFGTTGFLFHEAGGGLHVMSGDSEGSQWDRQKYIEFTARGTAAWGAGAW